MLKRLTCQRSDFRRVQGIISFGPAFQPGADWRYDPRDVIRFPSTQLTVTS
jgi:hypothetical protein